MDAFWKMCYSSFNTSFRNNKEVFSHSVFHIFNQWGAEGNTFGWIIALI